MANARLRMITIVCTVAGLLAVGYPAHSQTLEGIHTVEARLEHNNGGVGAMRVRLVRKDSLQTVGETFSRSEGRIVFSRVSDGEYLIETFETDTFQATSTEVILRPRPRRPLTVRVFIEIPLKTPTPAMPAGVITADVDIDVPKDAAKHYRNGTKAIKDGDSAKAISELQEAIATYPNYYAARLELGRELRLNKRLKEAGEILNPLAQIAPRRAEPRLEYGIVLLELKRPEEAVKELRAALELQETNSATHLYLGWALLESHPKDAEPHFKRALELDKRGAARAHLSLARIAADQGKRQLAVEHLDSYVALMPKAPDADAVRKLADKLRQ